MVDIVKKKLVALGDAKTQRQKLCLTLVDKNDKLLKTPSKTWDEIKSGNFMIINGQHTVQCSGLQGSSG